MKILSTEQIRQVDADTIANEPIASIDLMERAALTCFRRLIKLLRPAEPITVFCGKGNNGGDGLAIARLLIEHGFECQAILIHFSDTFSPDAEVNYTRLKEKYSSRLSEIHSEKELPEQTTGVAIDALLGTGTNKAASGLLADTIRFVNGHYERIISIDLPSGLFADSSSTPNRDIVQAGLVLSFQFPKLAFLLPENKNFVREFEILDIHLDQRAIDKHATTSYYLTRAEVAGLLKPRAKFSHKGSYGHALLLAGSKGKSGAALIAAEAVLRSGAGLLTLHSTKETLRAALQRLPETMSSTDTHPDHISELHQPENYDAIGIGPGMGQHEDSQNVLKKLLHYYQGKLVIDADGLNILSENKTWLSFLPPDTILTPHPKEFERLTEKHSDDVERLQALRQFSMKHSCIVVLKDAHSAIAMPDGNLFFNSSGNAGLAKGGSGDALTGILTGLLARGYSPAQAAIIGVFVHGYAADLCVKKSSKESLLATDLVAMLPKAFFSLEKLTG